MKHLGRNHITHNRVSIEVEEIAEPDTMHFFVAIRNYSVKLTAYQISFLLLQKCANTTADLTYNHPEIVQRGHLKSNNRLICISDLKHTIWFDNVA